MPKHPMKKPKQEKPVVRQKEKNIIPGSGLAAQAETAIRKRKKLLESL